HSSGDPNEWSASTGERKQFPCSESVQRSKSHPSITKLQWRVSPLPVSHRTSSVQELRAGNILLCPARTRRDLRRHWKRLRRWFLGLRSNREHLETCRLDGMRDTSRRTHPSAGTA